MSEGHRGTEGRQNGTRKEGEEKTKKNRRGEEATRTMMRDGRTTECLRRKAMHAQLKLG